MSGGDITSWLRAPCADGSCVEVAWVKSTASGAECCVEVAWAKGSACDARDCVEVAPGIDGEILVRDSKNPDVPPLRYTPAEWEAFLDGAKAGEFDHLIK